MTYGDLLPVEITAKLIATSFDDPSINLWAYKLYKSLLDYQEFFENERNKLIVKYGNEIENGKYQVPQCNVNEYREDLKKIISMPIDGKIPYFELTEDNFSAEHCQYSKDKEMWLSAMDINSILRFMEKVKSGD